MEALLFQPVCLIVDHIGERYLDCAVRPCGAGAVYRGSQCNGTRIHPDYAVSWLREGFDMEEVAIGWVHDFKNESMK